MIPPKEVVKILNDQLLYTAQCTGCEDWDVCQERCLTFEGECAQDAFDDIIS